MKVIEVRSLEFPDIKMIEFKRYKDGRGYFSESFRKSTIEESEKLSFLKGKEFVQISESFSRKNVIRGFHIQWEPVREKLVRVISGKMIDIVLDLRNDSPYFGKAISIILEVNPNSDSSRWIWIPEGFAHASVYLEDTIIEYMCTGEYNPDGEASISIKSDDIDWSMCKDYDQISRKLTVNLIISDRDNDGLSVAKWKDKF